MGSQSHRSSNKQMRLKHSICNIAPDQVTLHLYVEKQETNIKKICDCYLHSINLKERALILNGN